MPCDGGDSPWHSDRSNHAAILDARNCRVMAGAISIGQRHDKAGNVPAQNITAGTASRSGRTGYGLPNLCGIHSAGCALPKAGGPKRRWWTTSSHSVGTGTCSFPRRITKACANSTTTRRRRESRPRNDAETAGGYVRAGGCASVCGLTGAHGCAAAKPRRSPRLEKVLSICAQTPVLTRLRGNFPNQNAEVEAKWQEAGCCDR